MSANRITGLVEDVLQGNGVEDYTQVDLMIRASIQRMVVLRKIDSVRAMMRDDSSHRAKVLHAMLGSFDPALTEEQKNGAKIRAFPTAALVGVAIQQAYPDARVVTSIYSHIVKVFPAGRSAFGVRIMLPPLGMSGEVLPLLPGTLQCDNDQRPEILFTLDPDEIAEKLRPRM